MQLLPITFFDLNLLFAVGAILLLIAAEFSSSSYELTNLTIKNKLRKAGLVTGILFLITVGLRLVMLPQV